jgi:hypothetical protein
VSQKLACLRCADIDKTRAKINDVASNYEDSAMEEALILRGCVLVFNKQWPH